MKDFLEWFHEQYGFTIFIVITMLTLFVVITLKVFFAPIAIPAGTVTAYGTFFALAGLTFTLWKWRRSRKDREDADSNSG